jgi:hypothetical protein
MVYTKDQFWLFQADQRLSYALTKQLFTLTIKYHQNTHFSLKADVTRHNKMQQLFLTSIYSINKVTKQITNLHNLKNNTKKIDKFLHHSIMSSLSVNSILVHNLRSYSIDLKRFIPDPEEDSDNCF